MIWCCNLDLETISRALAVVALTAFLRLRHSCTSAAFAVIVIPRIGLLIFEASRNITLSHRKAFSKDVHHLIRLSRVQLLALLKANNTACVQVNIGKLSQGG